MRSWKICGILGFPYYHSTSATNSLEGESRFELIASISRLSIQIIEQQRRNRCSTVSRACELKCDPRDLSRYLHRFLLLLSRSPSPGRCACPARKSADLRPSQRENPS
ncbi:hypothetical protein NL676_019030 [Syzygium grande]|nr:hypothetical protein NL676_019030 [Syzygium grande]